MLWEVIHVIMILLWPVGTRMEGSVSKTLDYTNMGMFSIEESIRSRTKIS